MHPPFTPDQFFDVLVAYNESVWPAQLVWVALALLAVALPLSPSIRSDRAIATILGAMWIWMGVVYHWMFFARINPAAIGFGAAFVLEGAMILIYGFRRDGLRFSIDQDVFGVIGWILVCYALVLYPLLGIVLGHRYPEQPTFGLPCPGTILTMGLLLWGKPKVPLAVLLIPVLWSIIGSSAVILFGVIEDAILPLAGLVGGGLVLLKNHRFDRDSKTPSRAAKASVVPAATE